MRLSVRIREWSSAGARCAPLQEELMERWKNKLLSHTGELVMGLGALLVSMGAGMIYLPAGLIAGGVLAMAGAAVSILGGGDDQ